jgi:D-psicose/D-tagatose/L-ribulose 3-epimerase
MRIGVSNLAWAPEAEADALALLAAGGALGVEVAPTRIAPWGELTAARLATFRNSCSAAGLVIPSLQAIFYGRPSAQLLGSPANFAKMCEHLHLVGLIAGELGAGVVVFGAPLNRTRGELAEVDAWPLAVERLRALGEIASEHAMIIGMEPVPAQYGNDFAVSAHELATLLRTVAHPNVRFHMDCACVKLSGDDPVPAILYAADLLVHYHASEPELWSFDAPVCDHAACADALRQAKFHGWAVIEMRQHGDGLAAIAEALRLVHATYGRKS